MTLLGGSEGISVVCEHCTPSIIGGDAELEGIVIVHDAIFDDGDELIVEAVACGD